MTIFGKLTHAGYSGGKVLLLLLCLSVGCLYATEGQRMNTFQDTDKNVIADDTTAKGDIDSTEKYYVLIANENADSRYAQNVVGMAIGGAFIGGGTYFLVGGIYGIRYRSEDSFDQGINRGMGRVFIALSIPFYLVGIPVLTANIYYYIVHKNHAIKCDKYRDALKRYKLRRENEDSDAVRLMIVPTVNFTNAGGGVSLLAAF